MKTRLLVATLLFNLAVSLHATLVDKVYVGANDAAWETASNWNPAGVPGLSDNVFIPASKKVKVATEATAGALTVSNTAIVSVNGATSVVLDRIAANTTRTDPVSLTLATDLTLLGSGGLAIGGLNQLCTSVLNVGGDLVLSGTSKLAVYAGATNGTTVTFQTGGAQVTVTGKTRLETGTWIYPYCHILPSPQKSTGAPVVFNLQDVTIAVGAGFNANEKGYTQNSTCPGYALSGYFYHGGSYGGRGGRRSIDVPNPLAPYGFANAPFYPGGAGGNSPQGGGAIRIIAKDVLLDGTLTANGKDGAYSGGGAGGGIWMTCETLAVGNAALISAKGGSGGTTTHAAGGGGGRVAVGIGLTTGQLDALYASGTATDLAIVPLNVVLQERLTVKGNIGNGVGTAGEAGTGVFMINRSGAKLLQIDGNPRTYLGFIGPDYGPHAISDGSNVAFSVASPVFVSVDQRTRRVCNGYSITNAAGVIIASDTTTSGNVTVDEDLFLTWDWTQLEHTLELSLNGTGSITTNTISLPHNRWQPAGSEISLTAVPDPGNVFVGWIGEITGAQRTNSTITLTHDQARALTAVFAPSTAGTKTWTAGGDTLNWLDGANWTPSGVPGPNEAVQILSGTCLLGGRMIAEVGSLTIGASGFLKIAGSGTTVTTQTTIDATQTDSIGLVVNGDLSIQGKMSVGGNNQHCTSVLNAGGDLVLSGTAELAVYAGATNGTTVTFQTGGAQVTVTGETRLETGTWIYPYCHVLPPIRKSTGAPVVFNLKDVTIAAGAGFNANGRGYTRYSTCPGYSDSTGSYFGGSYGGRGGNNAATGLSSLAPYGFANAPFHPGGAGGNNPQGGGAIRITAQNMTLNGTLSANGTDAIFNGGGAGGGIWITCDTFTAGSTALISAKGGSGTSQTSGGGGGGRVAIGTGLTASQINALYATGEASDLAIQPLTAVLQERLTVAGGIRSGSGTTGEDGTGIFYLNRAGAKLLQIDGDPEAYLDSVTPIYGLHLISDGSNVSFSAVSPIFVSDDNRSRRICGGYSITNAAGAVIASGTTSSGNLTLDENLFLTWDWTQLEHTFGVAVNGNGSITTNAISHPNERWQSASSELSLTAVPDPGNIFLMWDGEITGAQRTNPSISLTLDQARDLTAVFASSAAGDKLWTAGGDALNWLDGANWTPTGVPGPNEAVQILSGTCLQDGRMIAEVGLLTIGSDAFLKISSSGTTVTGQTPTDTEQTDPVGLIVHGDLSIQGKMSIGGQHQACQSVLSIDGDLSLSGSAAQLAIYAGYNEPLALATYKQGGATVTVGGAITVADGCWIYPVCDAISGAPVVFEAERVTVAVGGGFNADASGWRWINEHGNVYHYGPGSSAVENYSGGCYGGMGGRSKYHIPSGTNYCHATAPYMPGSPGGNNGGENKGGGAIRINARIIHLYGTLTANGSHTAISTWSGGGSGGGIWVTCRFLRTGPETVLSVKGGNHVAVNGGGGGGGRIALSVGFSDTQIDEFYSAGSASTTYTIIDLEEGAQAQHIQGTLNIAGGTTTAIGLDEGGQPGTAVFVLGPPSETLISIR